MSIFENILRKSAIYAIAVVAARLSAVLLLPIYTRYLTPADYGVLELLNSAQMIFELLVGVRLSEGVLYFFSKARREGLGGERVVVSTAVWGGIGFGLLSIAVGWAAAEAASVFLFGDGKHAHLVRVAALAVGMVPVSEIGMSYLRALDEAAGYAIVSFGRLVVTIVICVLLLVRYGMGVEAVLWASVAGLAIPAAGLGAWMAWRNGIVFAASELVAQVKYSAPLCLSGLAMTLLHYGDRFFLQRAVPLDELGIYGLAYRIGMLVSFAVTPFYSYWHAQMFNLVRGKQGDELYVRVFTYLALVLCGAAVCLSLFAEAALRLLATPAFIGAAALVPFVALAYVLRGLGDQLRSVFSLCMRTDLAPIVTGAGMTVCFALYWLLIPSYGVKGALAATIAGFATMAAAAYVMGQRLRRFEFETGRLVKLLALSLAAVTAFRLLAPQGFWLRNLFASLVLAAWVGGLFATRFVSENESAWLRRRMRESLAWGSVPN